MKGGHGLYLMLNKSKDRFLKNEIIKYIICKMNTTIGISDDVITAISITLSFSINIFIYLLYYYLFSECIDINKNKGSKNIMGLIIYISTSVLTISGLIIPFSITIYFDFFIMWGMTLLVAIIFIISYIFYSIYINRFKQYENF